jgi:DNA-binding transcriptional LysR family regulator
MLELFKIFIAVAEERNFTKAGERLNLSQPSVSLHIKHLEQEFDTLLIDRSPKYKHIRLTPAGELLYKRAKQMLSFYEETKETVINFYNELKGTLRIAASFTVGEYVLPALLVQFQKQYPQVEFDVIIENTEAVAQSVRSLQVDIGLIEGPIHYADLLVQTFMKDEMVLVVPNNHPCAYKPFRRDAFHNQNWVAREAGSATRQYMDNFLQTYDLQVNKVTSISSNQGVKEAVVNGMGITMLSLWVVKRAAEQKDLSIISLPDSYIRHFSYVLPAHLERTKLLDAFLETINTHSLTI